MNAIMNAAWFANLMYAISGAAWGVALAIVHERYDLGIRY